MKFSFTRTGRIALWLIVLIFLLCPAESMTQASGPRPLVLTVQIEAAKPIYKLNGKEVEDRRDNSLLKNLTEAAKRRGTKIPVIEIIDVRAPLTEVGKLETTLDKVDFTSNRRLFVSDFHGGTMNEIHWDHRALPIPKD
jgi:hypothetical protein